MDITFACESCGQGVVIDEAGAGQLVDCPGCGAQLEVPYKSKSLDGSARANLRAVTTEPPPSPSVPTSHTKKCPFCAETINAEAIKCKHCGEFLDSKPRAQGFSPATKSIHQATPVEAATVSQGNIIAGYSLAIIVPFIGFFVGIYLLAKKQPGHGVACMAISVVACLFWIALMNGC